MHLALERVTATVPGLNLDPVAAVTDQSDRATRSTVVLTH